MAAWTKLQQEYVRDIEKNLKIIYQGDRTKKSASLFIARNKKANYNYLLKRGLVKQNPRYKILTSISRKAFDFIDEYYAEKQRFTERDVEGEWNNFVEGLV